MTDLDILHSARMIFERHGDDAFKVAADRMAALIEKGDTDGATTWTAIALAIMDLQEAQQGEAAN